MFDKKTIFLAILTTVFFTILLAVILKTQSGTGAADVQRLENIVNLANELVNKELYDQAIEKYQEYLLLSTLPHSKEANIHYIMGKLYMDRLKDYQNAMAEMVAVTVIDPESELRKDAKKRIVECLERLQRSLDAKNVLEEETRLTGVEVTPKPKKGELVAMLGDRQITMGDIEAKINEMPPYMQQQFDSPEKKLEFLKQYIASELMYDSAKRKGYSDDKDIIAKAFEYKKSLMVEKLAREEIGESASYTMDDLKLYYEAHKDEFQESEGRQVRHILCTTKEKAKKVKQMLDEGNHLFEEVAKKESQDANTTSKGGMIGKITKDGPIPGFGNLPEFTEAVYELEPGDVSDIVQTDKGYHIIKVEYEIPARQRAFEEVREQVERLYQQHKQQQAMEQLFQRMLKADKVKIYEDVFLANVE